jgi:hypothetical protein
MITAALELLTADEERFHRLLCYYLMAMFVLSFVALMVGFKAEYGRYATGSSCWKMNGKLAWVLQEIPVLIVGALCHAYGTAACTASLPNMFLLSLVLSHYVNRTFVFPMRIRGGKSTTIYTMLLALTFCVVNGYIQARYLCSFEVRMAVCGSARRRDVCCRWCVCECVLWISCVNVEYRRVCVNVEERRALWALGRRLGRRLANARREAGGRASGWCGSCRALMLSDTLHDGCSLDRSSSIPLLSTHFLNTRYILSSLT